MRPRFGRSALAVAVLWGLLSYSGLLAHLESLAALVPGRYRALTKIRVREKPDIASNPTGAVVVAGELFDVDEVQSSGGMGYLKLADGGGWVFDQGTAGRWAGQPILEPVQGAAATEPIPVTPPPSAAPKVSSAPVADVQSVDFGTAPSFKSTSADVLEPAVALALAQVETLRLPANVLGAGFELVQLSVPGARQPLTFLLGSAFPLNVITPRGQELAGKTGGGQFSGGWLASAAKAAGTVNLEGVKFLTTGGFLGDLKGVEVMDFPQAELCSQLGVEVHGMLGQPFFSEFDLDLDRYRGAAQLYAPGTAAAQGFYSTVKHLPGIALPSGNMGVVVKGKPVVEGEEEIKQEGFVGIVDSSAPHTTLNWEAAKQLGFSGPTDPRLAVATKVLGAGPQGTPIEMPVVLVKLSLCSAPEGVRPMMSSVSKEQWESSGGKGWYFADLSGGTNSINFGAVNVAIGDTLSLSVLRDSKIGPFTGAAAIIGQDLLFQAQRIVLNMRDKQMWMEPGDMRDAEEM